MEFKGEPEVAPGEAAPDIVHQPAAGGSSSPPQLPLTVISISEPHTFRSELQVSLMSLSSSFEFLFLGQPSDL